MTRNYISHRVVRSSNMNASLSIRQRIISLVVVVALLQIIATGIILSQLVTIEHHVSAVAKTDIPITKAMSLITEHQLKQEIVYEKAFRYALEIASEPKAERHFTNTVEKFDLLSKQISTELNEVEQFISQALLHAQDDIVIAEFNKVNGDIKKIKQQHENWEEHAHKVFVTLVKQDFHQAEEISAQVEREAEQLTGHIESVLHELENFTEQSVLRIDKEAVELEFIAVAVVVVTLAVTIFMSWLVLRAVRVGLKKAVSSLAIISHGDFAKPVNTDEPGEVGVMLTHMETMRKNINQVLIKVNGSTDEVQATAEALAKANTAVQDNLSNQFQQIELVATAINELSSTALEVASNTNSTLELTETASNSSQQSQSANLQAMEHISELVESLSDSGDALTKLEANSEKIESVLDVIKGIAEQTNLLALNAAIEAARAGEQGRGFAVVADEVRNLAQRTQESTSEIEQMVEQYRNGAKNAVIAMAHSRELSSKTIEFSESSSALMAEVNSVISSVNDMATQIATAAEEQHSVVEEINTNITQVNDASQENKHEIEMATDATNNLQSSSNALHDEMSEFKLDEK